MHPVDQLKLAMIEKYGFCFNPVRSNGTDFVYTAGLHKNFGQPEIFVMGYQIQDAVNLIGLIFERIKAGERFKEPSILVDLWADSIFAIRPMTQESTNANAVRGQSLVNEEFPAVQLFFTDHADLFPWDEGCDERCKRLQTALLVVTPEIPSRTVSALKPN